MDLFSSMLDGYVKGFRRIPYCYWLAASKARCNTYSYKVLQCPTKLFHTSTFNLKNASPSQAYECRT